ncbi:hypothetical protein FRC19_003922 [Serendipita sp. 401]|nr:hypothetical protein FRC19_003922 [Serendipita sp. 401]
MSQTQLLQSLGDTASTSADTVEVLKRFIRDLDIPERRILVMKAINAVTIALGHVQKSGWMSSAPIPPYSQSAVENTILSAEISLTALRVMKSGVNIEKATLNFVGKLLALKLYEAAWHLLPSTKIGICSILHDPQSVGSKELVIPHPQSELSQDPDLILVIVTYLSYEAHALLHKEPRLVTSLFWDMVSAVNFTTGGYILSWLTSPGAQGIADKLLPLCTSLLKAVELKYTVFGEELSVLLRIYAIQCVLSVGSGEEYKWIWKQARNVVKEYIKYKSAASSSFGKIFDKSLMSCVEIAGSRYGTNDLDADPSFQDLLSEWRRLPVKDRDKAVLGFIGAPTTRSTVNPQFSTSNITIRASKLSLCLTGNPQEFGTLIGTWCEDIQKWASNPGIENENDWTNIYNGLEKLRRKFRRTYESSDLEKYAIIVFASFSDVYSRLIKGRVSSRIIPDLVSATIECRIVLSKHLLKHVDAHTYGKSLDQLTTSLHLLEDSHTNKELVATGKFRTLRQCISGALWNLGSSLYQAGHWDHAIPFISEGVMVDRDLLQTESIDDKGEKYLTDQFYQQMPRRMMLLASCYVKLGERLDAYKLYRDALACLLTLIGRPLDTHCRTSSGFSLPTESPFQHLIGLIERITVIGAYELRLSADISVDTLSLPIDLSPISRGTLIEAQISILRHDTRKNYIGSIVQELLKSVEAIYQKGYPIRFARIILTRIELGYYTNYPWHEALNLAERCLTLLTGEDLISDTILAGYRDQIQIKLFCWMQLHAHTGQKLDVIKKYALSALNLLQELASRATSSGSYTPTTSKATAKNSMQKTQSKSSRINRQSKRTKPDQTISVEKTTLERIPLPEFTDDFWHLMEHMWLFYGAIGQIEWKLWLLNSCCRLLSVQYTKIQEEVYAKTLLELAHQCNRIGKFGVASVHYSQCLAVINGDAVSNSTRIMFLLRFARHLATIRNVDKSKELYSEAQELYSKNHEEREDLSQKPEEKLRTKCMDWRVASEACLAYAYIQMQYRNLPSVRRAYMQSLRLQKAALEFLRRFTKVEELRPVERNPFDMEDLGSTLPVLDPQLDNAHAFSSGPKFEGWHWYFANGLLEATMSVATYHFLKGNHQDASFFAQEARKCSEGINSFQSDARAIFLEIQIALHLGKVDAAFESLSNMENTIADLKPSVAHSQWNWLLSACYQRRGEHSRAEMHLKEAEVSLQLLDQLLDPTIILDSSTSTLETDIAYADILASVVAAHAWGLRNSNHEVPLVTLEKMGTHGTPETIWRYSLATLSLHKSTGSIWTDSSLGSFSDSVLGIRAIDVTKSSKAMISSRIQLMHQFEDTLGHCWSALEVLPYQGSSFQYREVALKLVQAMIKLSAFGKSVRADTVATLFDLAVSWTIHRELLDSIGEKVHISQQPDDLNWPSMVQRPIAISSKSSQKGSQLSLMTSIRETGDRFADDHWSDIESRILSRRYDEDLQPLPFGDLPLHWTVVTMSVSDTKDSILISRCRGDQPVLMFDIPLKRNARSDQSQSPSMSVDWVTQELKEIIELSCQNGKRATEVINANREARAQWWSERSLLDKRLSGLLEDIEFCWLGGFKAAFLDHMWVAEETFTTIEGVFHQAFRHLLSSGGRSSLLDRINPAVIRCFAQLSPDCRNEELEDIIYFVLDAYQLAGNSISLSDIDIDEGIIDLRRILREIRHIQTKKANLGKKQHLFLILDRNLQAIPWESTPILRGRAVSRVPSLAFLFDSLRLAKARRAGDDGPLPVDRFSINPSHTFYVLNPGGDLRRTEEKFKPWVQQMSKVGWSGIIGRKPTEFELVNALDRSDLFIYFGHGGAEQYIRGSRIRTLKNCAAAMLWGCSSGLMADAGDFERSGTPYNYLIGGCQSLVANLWDVTDKDIDKFAEAVFKELRMDVEGVKTELESSEGVSVVDAVARARSVCKLPYLTGAAPIVYGIPFYL